LKNEVTIKNILSSPESLKFSCNGAKQDTFVTIILRSLKSYLNTTPLNHDTILRQPKSPTDKIAFEKQKMGKEEKENLTSLAYRNYKSQINSQHGIRTKTSTKSVGVWSGTLATSSSSNISNSHYLVRQSIRFYAASSVILALCYLTTPISASIDSPSHPV
jgi:hypothetical protein